MGRRILRPASLVAGCCAVLLAACELAGPEPHDLVAGGATVEVDGRPYRARAYYHVEAGAGESREVISIALGPGDTLRLSALQLRPGTVGVDTFRTEAAFEAMHLVQAERVLFTLFEGSLQIDEAEGPALQGSFDLVLVDALASCLVCETTRKEVVSGRFHTVAR